MIELMKELCALPGPSGCEDAVRAFVLKRVKPFADEIRTDAIGNVMVFRKGRKALDRPVAVCAHMDEVGVIIKKITEALIRALSSAVRCASVMFRASSASRPSI